MPNATDAKLPYNTIANSVLVSPNRSQSLKRNKDTQASSHSVAFARQISTASVSASKKPCSGVELPSGVIEQRKNITREQQL